MEIANKYPDISSDPASDIPMSFLQKTSMVTMKAAKNIIAPPNQTAMRAVEQSLSMAALYMLTPFENAVRQKDNAPLGKAYP